VRSVSLLKELQRFLSLWLLLFFTLKILLKVNFAYFFSHTNLALTAKNKKRMCKLGIMGGNPKDEPLLTYGEVFSVWSSLKICFVKMK